MKNSKFNYFHISQEIVRTFICKLPNKCNSSSEGLPKGMLKKFRIHYPSVFQRFLDEGQCPTIWNSFNIILIFKNVIIHYHPIIVQSVYWHPLSAFKKNIILLSIILLKN